MISAAVHHISTFQAIVLGVLQGISELFPVSSLGHTVIFPHLFGWNNIVVWQSQTESPWLAFIVMLHVGSAIGLLIYFWRDWVDIVGALIASIRKRRIETSTERLGWLLVVATIPTGLAGIALEHAARTGTAKPEIASIFLVVNGFVLMTAEHYRRRGAARGATRGGSHGGSRREAAAAASGRARARKPAPGRSLESLDYKEAAGIGVAQAGGIIAGISRDGMVMATGLARGLDNADAGRFGFLLATPIILAAGVYKLGDLTGPNGDGVRGAAVVAAIVAAITAVFTVHFLTRYFKRGNLRPFGLYCIVFGAAMVLYNL